MGLARPYSLSSDTAKAKSTYQDFFSPWKTPTQSLERSQGRGRSGIEIYDGSGLGGVNFGPSRYIDEGGRICDGIVPGEELSPGEGVRTPAPPFAGSPDLFGGRPRLESSIGYPDPCRARQTEAAE